MLSLLSTLVLATAAAPQTSPDLVPLLRATRIPGWPGAAAVQEQVTLAVVEDVTVAVNMLVAREVPPVEDEDTAQVLSEVQLEMLLVGLESADSGVLRQIAIDLEATARSLAQSPTTALWILGVSGSGSDGAQSLEWANRAVQEERHDRTMRPALRRCLTRIVERDPTSFGWLGTAFQSADRETLLGALPAMGDARNPLAISPLIEVIQTREDVADVAVSEILRVGRSLDINVNQEACNVLRPFLNAQRPTMQQVTARAMAVLGDTAMIPMLIQFLEDDERGLREAALWSLQTLAGRSAGADAAGWATWYGRELEWRDQRITTLAIGLRSTDPSKQADSILSIAHRELFVDGWAQTLMDARPSTPQVRILICRTLGELGAVTSIPFLLERSTEGSPELHETCRVALEQILGEPLPLDDDGQFRWDHSPHADYHDDLIAAR